MKRILSFIVAALLTAVAYASPSENLIFALPQPVTRSTLEVFDFQMTVNPGDIQTGDELHIRATGIQPGTTDASKLHVRLGTSCTSSDFDMNAHAVQSFLGPTIQSGGTDFVLKFLTNTTVIRGGGVLGQGSYYWVGGANPNPDTILDLSTTTQCLSISVVSTGATDPVTMHTLTVRKIRP
jgi:hypothetical protein